MFSTVAVKPQGRPPAGKEQVICLSKNGSFPVDACRVAFAGFHSASVTNHFVPSEQST